MKPKSINGKTFTGSMLLSLTFEYLDALNSGSAPKIYSSVERIIHAEARKICDELMSEYHEKVKRIGLPNSIVR
jgi:hypothetical protein